VDAKRRSAPAVASPVLSIGSAALLLQGFFVYLIATISKLRAPRTVLSGDAEHGVAYVLG
jgi:hypothetical protein